MAMRNKYYYVLCANPLILGCTGGFPRDGRLNRPVLSKDVLPITLLQHFSWYFDNEKYMAEVKLVQERCTEIGLDYRAMVSTAEENQLRIIHHVKGAHIGHNIHVNEHVFRPLECDKNYDAVYVAQLESFKRHDLAMSIKKLMVVSYGGNLHQFCPALEHADFNPSFLPASEVAEKINQAQTGLCLSAIEGEMNASVEYLACGVPVVTTPSLGGRDQYFDKFNSITVTPDPKSVAAAVNQWQRQDVQSSVIRQRVLKKLYAGRERYCKYIATIINKNTGERVSADWLNSLYYGSGNGMYSRELLPEIIGNPGVMAKFQVELPYHIPVCQQGMTIKPVDRGYHLTRPGGSALFCNFSGMIIWELCDGNTCVADIVDTVIAEFSLPPARARIEVLDTLKEFVNFGIISGTG